MNLLAKTKWENLNLWWDDIGRLLPFWLEEGVEYYKASFVLTAFAPLEAGIKIAKRNINDVRYAADTTLMVESEEELKSVLIKLKEECEKAGLKLNIQETKIMASYLITSLQYMEK